MISLLTDMPEEISSEGLKELIDASFPLTLVDVRHTWEYKICHLNNSLHLCLADLDQHLSTLPVEQLIVTICHHGVRSRQAMLFLRQHGFKCTSLQGGVDAWAQIIEPTMETY